MGAGPTAHAQPVNQSVSQPVNQPASQPASQSTSQPVNQSISQPVSSSQPAQPPASQPASQSISQDPENQTGCQYEGRQAPGVSKLAAPWKRQAVGCGHSSTACFVTTITVWAQVVTEEGWKPQRPFSSRVQSRHAAITFPPITVRTPARATGNGQTTRNAGITSPPLMKQEGQKLGKWWWWWWWW